MKEIRREGRQIYGQSTKGGWEKELLKEAERKCGCKPAVKTCLITSRNLKEGEIKELAKAPHGILIVTESAKDLGLTVYNPRKRRLTEAQRAEKILEPYVTKMRRELGKLMGAYGSVMDRLSHYNGYFRAKLFYPATQVEIPKKINDQILDWEADLLGTKNWIRHGLATQMFQAMRIVSTGTTKQCMQQSLITAAIREHGREVLAATGKYPLADKAYKLICDVAIEAEMVEDEEREDGALDQLVEA